jgi:hypothetical protein
VAIAVVDASDTGAKAKIVRIEAAIVGPIYFIANHL